MKKKRDQCMYPVDEGRIYSTSISLSNSSVLSGKISFKDKTMHVVTDAHIINLQAVIYKSIEVGSSKIRLHMINRDVVASSFLRFVVSAEAILDELRRSGVDVAIASGGNRVYVKVKHDTKDGWISVKRRWNEQSFGKAPRRITLSELLLELEDLAVDENIPPFVIVNENQEEVGSIRAGDAVVTFST